MGFCLGEGESTKMVEKKRERDNMVNARQL